MLNGVKGAGKISMPPLFQPAFPAASAKLPKRATAESAATNSQQSAITWSLDKVNSWR